jgi:hypothetical protein
MAALDYQQNKRPHGWVHDWLPLLVVAILCFLVVAFDVKL